MKDLLPVLVVFFVVSVIGTLMVLEYVVNDPVVVPAKQAVPGSDPDRPTPFVPRR